MMYLFEDLDREFWILLDYKHIYFIKQDAKLKYVSELIDDKKVDIKIPIKVVVNDQNYMDYHMELLDGKIVAKTFITNFNKENTNLIANPHIEVKTLRKTGPRMLALAMTNDIPDEYSVCIDNYVGLTNGVFWDMPYTAYRSYDGFPYCNDKLGEVITEKEALKYAKDHLEEMQNFFENVTLANQNLLKYNSLHIKNKNGEKISNNHKIITKKK